MALTIKKTVAEIDQWLTSSIISDQKREYYNWKRMQAYNPTDEVEILKWPERFMIENLDPYTLKVQIVTEHGVFDYENILRAEIVHGFNQIVGPMADKINDEWCIRFESKKVYELLSK